MPSRPNANRTAQEDVEKALMEWGRFSLALNSQTADLLITVRKGSGKIARPTLDSIPNNNRPVVPEPTNSGGRIAVIPGSGPDSSPQPQVEAGQSQDMFVVYRCTSKDDENWAPLDAPPVWRMPPKMRFCLQVFLLSRCSERWSRIRKNSWPRCLNCYSLTPPGRVGRSPESKAKRRR